MSAVSAPSETAWTCCLEVAGEPNDLVETFVAVGADLFGEDSPVELGNDASLGYAEWLRRVMADPGLDSAILLPSGR